MEKGKRPPVRIKFKYNKDSGEIEELIIDDNARSASEEYHKAIAQLIAEKLGSNPEISDAGPIDLNETQPGEVTKRMEPDVKQEPEKKKENL